MRSKGIEVKMPFLIIRCNNTLKMIWDILVLILVVWLAAYLPIIIAFPSLEIYPLDVTIVVVFMLDIVFCLRTTYFDKEGDEIIDPKLIAMNYLFKY